MYRANYPSAPGFNGYGYSESSPGSSYTRVSYRRNPGYFERVGNSFCGIATGIIIVMIAFPVLFLNEGRAVQTAKSLDEGLYAVVDVTPNAVFESNNEKLVYLSGKLKTFTALTDPDFDVNVYTVKLRRTVEMYQWIEHEHKREYNEGDRTRIETTYTYSNEWRSEIVNSGAFSNSINHKNPNSFVINSFTKTADPVFVGEFHLSRGLISKVTDFRTLQLKSLPHGRNDFVLLDRYFYRSADPYHPKIGDLRISFSYAGVSGEQDFKLGVQDVVSIVAKQQGSSLNAYQTNAGDQLELLYSGRKTAKEIFAAEHSTNTILTWVLRFVGWLMMFVGLQVMMDIVRQIVSFLPIVREIVGLATSLIAFTLASTLALVTIAIGWLRYRPLLATALLLGAAVPLYMSRQKAARDKKEEGKE